MILDPHQLAFVGFYLNGAPDRRKAQWLGAGQRVLGEAIDPANPPPGAVAVRVYRLTDGGLEGPKGNRAWQRTLAVQSLPRLANLWAEPFKALNAAGLAIAATAGEPAINETFRLGDTMQNYRLPPISWRELENEAARRGVKKTQIILEGLALYFEAHRT